VVLIGKLPEKSRNPRRSWGGERKRHGRQVIGWFVTLKNFVEWETESVFESYRLREKRVVHGEGETAV